MSLSNSMALRNKRKPRLKAKVKQQKAFFLEGCVCLFFQPVDITHIMAMVKTNNKRSIRSAVFN